MRSITALVLAAGVMLASCGTESASESSGTASIGAESGTVTVLSHDSFAAAVTEETFAGFTAATGVEVEVLPAGDAGSMVNQAILTRDAPLADLLFGVDDTFLTRALDEDLFEATDVRPEPLVAGLGTDPDGRVVPIDFGDVCINYDRDVISVVPASLDDLTDPAFADALVVESPATSSPGLAFLLATIAAYGEDGWQAYWRDLADNGVRVVGDWDQAYYAEFTRYGGDRPLVVSYASSPPAEVLFAEEPLAEAPTGVVEAGCYRQTEYAGVLAGADDPASARALLDFLFSVEFQEQVPLNWFVFPANADAALPSEFVEFTSIPDNPSRLDAAEIDANRERWIEEWTAIMTP